MFDQPFMKFAEVWSWCGEASLAIYTVQPAFRGHTREACQSALGDLTGHGWVHAAGEEVAEVAEPG